MTIRVCVLITIVLTLVIGASVQGNNNVVVRATDIDCPVGTCLLFQGTTANNKESSEALTGVELTLNNKVVDESDSGLYTLRFTTTETGEYAYRVRGVFRSGDRCILQRGSISVKGPADCGLAFSRVRMRNLNRLTLVPKSRSFTSKIDLQVITNRAYAPNSYKVTQTDGEYSVDITGLAFGKLTTYAETVVGDCHYVSPEYEVNRRQPVELSTTTPCLDIDKNGILKLNVTLTGLEKTSVSILADNKAVGTQEIEDGDNEIDINAARASANLHHFSASIKSGDSAYQSTVLDVDLKSVEQPKKLRKQKVYWDKMEETRLVRKKLDTRRKILAAAATVLGSRIGKAVGVEGVIRGLCVASSGPFEFGQTIPIRLSVRPSTDHKPKVVWQNSAVDLDTEVSLRNALRFAESYINQRRPGFRAGDYHYIVKLGTGGAMGGDSAGAALTSLLISHFLSLPIRSDIAVTGTVEPSGAVGEVADYAEKSFAAFIDPGVTTLVIPRTRQAIDESTSVAVFVVTHRIIAARNMDQILRHVLVTPDVQLSLCESSWLNALAAYRANQNTVALQYLDAIRSAVPEDLTCELWHDWLTEDSKLEGAIRHNDEWAADFRRQYPEVTDLPDENSSGFSVISKSSLPNSKK